MEASSLAYNMGEGDIAGALGGWLSSKVLWFWFTRMFNDSVGEGGVNSSN